MRMRYVHRGFLAAMGMLCLFSVCLADEPVPNPQAGQVADVCAERSSRDAQSALDGVQFETTDIKSFEMLFGDVLKAPLIERRDHPDKDSIRGWCYRGIRIVVRRDYAVPRPTGWVQINFSVPDVGAVQRELGAALKDSAIASLEQMEREKIVRIRLKPDVRRGSRKADRLEVAGPEGFMMGFNQYKEETSH
jgi:hypothetical protein